MTRILLAALALASGCVCTDRADGVMPDVPPLRTDGWAERRTALKRMFLEEVYGERPVERPADLRFETGADRSLLGGTAVHRQVRIRATGPKGAFAFTANAYLPKDGTNLPTFVYAYLGSTARKQVFAPLAECPDTEAFPVSAILKRGYAVVQFDNWEVAMDDPESCFGTGVFAAWGPSAAERTDRSWGAISAWAWGASRVLDWIETQPEFDVRRVAVIGHSRGGKTALLAGVTDERFALACVNDSGCSGAKLNHMDLPLSESIGQINERFPHWFCRRYHRYGGKESEMPFDQHQMVALMAPRAVAIASSSEDAWAGPCGEFACARMASSAWEVYGQKGLVSPDDMPQPDCQLADGMVSYHIKKGPHSITVRDWNWYMDFESKLQARKGIVRKW